MDSLDNDLDLARKALDKSRRNSLVNVTSDETVVLQGILHALIYIADTIDDIRRKP